MAISTHLTGIQHIGIPTKDLDATTVFFTSLGFESRHEVKNADGEVVCKFLGLGNMVIETYVSPAATGVPGAIDHITLDTTDVEAVYKEVKASGQYTLEEDKITFLPFWEKGCKFFKVIGPNAEIVEFCEIIK